MCIRDRLEDPASGRRFLRGRRRCLSDRTEMCIRDSQGELREAIRHERRVELGLEFDRFYDLVRWGIAKEVLQLSLIHI